MSFELFKKIIDETKEHIEYICLWNLGEPFMNPDIFTMIQYAKRFGIYVMSSSNGFVFYKRSTTLRLIDTQMDRLIVGMDGLDAKTLNQYRVGVKFDKLIPGLRLVQAEKKRRNLALPLIDFQFIIMKHNQHQLEAARKLSKELDTTFRMKFVSLEMVDANNKQRFLPDKESHRIYDILKQRAALKRPLVNKPCVAWDGLVINWDGTVNPCIFDYYSKVVLGNVKEKTVMDVWQSHQFTKLKKNILKDRGTISICVRCPIQERYSEEYLL